VTSTTGRHLGSEDSQPRDHLLPPASCLLPPAPHTNYRLTQERLDALKLEYIAHRSERGRDAVELLTAERRAKLLRMAGKKDEAAEVDRQIEGLRLAKKQETSSA
jgi:hypothetical protein